MEAGRVKKLAVFEPSTQACCVKLDIFLLDELIVTVAIDDSNTLTQTEGNGIK